MSDADKTNAKSLYANIAEKGPKVKMLDGDDIRNNFHSHLSFTPSDSMKNNELVAQMYDSLKTEFDHILVPMISPLLYSRK